MSTGTLNLGWIAFALLYALGAVALMHCAVSVRCWRMSDPALRWLSIILVGLAWPLAIWEVRPPVMTERDSEEYDA